MGESAGRRRAMMGARSAWGWSSAYPAPAKLNLFLHVVGRRADGYHLLQTLFRFVDYGDVLRFSPRTDGAVHLARPLPGVSPDADLTVRAARLLQAETGCRQGVEISVEKHLPMGGGLGGGSSDAATVLLALNHLWQLGLSRQRLQAMALTLGADVPVFIFGRSAFAEGVGETLQVIELQSACYLVLEPPVQVPTALVFAAPALKRDSVAIAASDWHAGFGVNDLQPVVAARFPQVAEHLACLNALGFGEVAKMSGSGACVFAEFPSSDEAAAALRGLPQGLRGWLAAGLDKHPLYALAD